MINLDECDYFRDLTSFPSFIYLNTHSYIRNNIISDIFIYLIIYCNFGKQPPATGNDAQFCLMIKIEWQPIHNKYFPSILRLLHLKFQHNSSKGS